LLLRTDKAEPRRIEGRFSCINPIDSPKGGGGTGGEEEKEPDDH